MQKTDQSYLKILEILEHAVILIFRNSLISKLKFGHEATKTFADWAIRWCGIDRNVDSFFKKTKNKQVSGVGGQASCTNKKIG